MVQANSLPPFIQKLLKVRGITNPEQFLRPSRWGDIPQPASEPGVRDVVMRLADAVRSNQRVAIFGDYDADGIVGAAILHSVLSLKGLRPKIELPCRTQGYGLTNEAVHRFSRAGVQLLITVDNGIAAHDAIRLAYRLGIDVIVIDHHFKQSDPPQAIVLWNPTHCASTLAFMVAWELAMELDIRPIGPLLSATCRLAAIAAIADGIPLTGTIRTLVRLGFSSLCATTHPGLQMLLESAGIHGIVRSRDVAFNICPVLNAPGRIAAPMMALDMLIEQDKDRATSLAESLIQLNHTRCRVQLGELAHIEYDRSAPAIVAVSETCLLGIAGSLAANLAESEGKPTIILTKDSEGGYTGSGRGAAGVDLFAGLNSSASLLSSWGGHSNAVGLSLKAVNLTAFKKEFISWAAFHCLAPDKPLAETTITLEEYDLAACSALDAMEPLGPGNPAPLARIDNVTVQPLQGSQILVTQGLRSVKMRVDRDFGPMPSTPTSLLLELNGRTATVRAVLSADSTLSDLGDSKVSRIARSKILPLPFMSEWPLAA
jgi:single-stranded-DNA-specific exonuclease